MTLEEFFEDRDEARELFDAVIANMADLGRFETRVSKSQIAYRRRRDFAWIWCPDRYLRGPTVAPLALSLSLPVRDVSPRWKEVVEPSPGRFMHHLELRNRSDLDDEARHWLRQAYAFAQ
jgi:hypothetical protein